LKIRQAGAAQNNGFAIEDRGFDGQLRRRLNNPLVAVRPVVAPAGKCARLPALDDKLRPVAVIFDFMQPVGLLGRV